MIKKFENYIKEANGIRDEYSKVGVHNYYNDNKDVYVNPHLENIHLVLDWVLNKMSIKSFIDLSCGNGEVTSYLKEKGINDGVGTDPYFNLIYKKKTGNECLKLSFEDIAIKGLNLKKQSIICSYALHLCPESYFNQLLYNLSISSEYFILISPSKYPVISDNYFELIDETIINRTHCKIFKSKNSLNESLLDKLEGPSNSEMDEHLISLNNDYLALEIAIENGYLNGVKKYIKSINGKSYNEKDRLLDKAIDSGNTEIVNILINKGAEINHDNSTPIYYAAENGDYNMVEFILKYYLENGYDIRDIELVDVITTADNNGLEDIIELVEEYEKKLRNNNLNESLLDNIKGPSKEEVLNNIINSDDPFGSLMNAISLDFQEGIEFIAKKYSNDTKINGLSEWYNSYIKKWFSDKMKLTEVVDSKHITKQVQDDDGNDLDFKKNNDNLYYVNKYTGQIYLEISFENGEEQYYYNYNIFYSTISNDSRIIWRHCNKILMGLTKYYFNETPTYTSFSPLDKLIYKK